MSYSPADYYTLGASYPRDGLRVPYPRRAPRPRMLLRSPRRFVHVVACFAACPVVAGVQLVDAWLEAEVGSMAHLAAVCSIDALLAASVDAQSHLSGVVEVEAVDVRCGDLLMNNTTAVRLVELKVDGVVSTSATVVMTLRDKTNGNVIVGAENLTLTHVAAGTYRGLLPHTLALVLDRRYVLTVNATVAGEFVGEWEAERLAKKRDASRRC